MIYYEILEDNSIGRSTNNINIAKKNGYYNENNIVEKEEDIVYSFDGKRYLKENCPLKPQYLIDKEKDEQRKNEIQSRLNKLSQDFIQAQCGAIFDDIEQRKLEFQTLHNELRTLQGKEPRQYSIKGE